jgi:hypothetical protein
MISATDTRAQSLLRDIGQVRCFLHSFISVAWVISLVSFFSCDHAEPSELAPWPTLVLNVVSSIRTSIPGS